MRNPAVRVPPRTECSRGEGPSFFIRDVHLFDPSCNLDARGGIFVKGGRIAALGPDVTTPEGVEVMDGLVGCYVFPGFLDIHTHLRSPGLEYKEDIVSAGRAAAAGGYVLITGMANTDPPVDCGPLASWVLDRAAAESSVRVAQVGGVSRGPKGLGLSEMRELLKAGVVAFSGDGVMHEGRWSARLGFRGIPVSAETAAVARDLEILRDYVQGRGEDIRLHVQHVSTEGSVRLIRDAKRDGIPVTAEVTPHHLLLTDELMSGFDPNLKINPPLRSERDREALVAGLREGIIDCVATDHAPHASHDGKMVTFTYPMIGNYGVSETRRESNSVHSRGVIVREAKNTHSNQSSEEAWVDWLERKGVVGVGGVDTRALTRRIRDQGAMNGAIAGGEDISVEEILEEVRSHPSLLGRDLAGEVSSPEVRVEGPKTAEHHVVVFDYGVKRSILRNILMAGCRVTVVPARTSAAEVMAYSPDGVLLSNGPGDPEPLHYAVKTIGELLGRVPVFGICLGHQLMAQALGLGTFKLKFGHRGINHPVKNYLLDRIEITSQNHGFAVALPEGWAEIAEEAGYPAHVEPEKLEMDSEFGRVRFTHLNLNDGTVEGLRVLDLSAFSVQYHPEAGPGPHDSFYLFGEFTEMMRRWG